ncbi:hypothetical protein BGZ73_009245 [Actinomortierella ambigua]|nr:hypothetical protein BGZ73_009245 [Actinomortierella ambigua]
MEYQEFCFNNETLRFPVHADESTGRKFSRLDDVQDVFPQVHRVMLDGVVVPFMVDAHQQKYEPKRIPHYPTKVLQLLAPASTTTAQDPPTSSPPEYTPEDNHPPAYRDANAPPPPVTPEATLTRASSTFRPPRQKPASTPQGNRGGGNDLLTNSFEIYQDPIPRLFVLLPPPNPSTVDELRCDADGYPLPDFRLYFLCEHSTLLYSETTPAPARPFTCTQDGNVHLTNHPGYEIRDWDRFLDSYGMHVLRTLLRLTLHLEATRTPHMASLPNQINRWTQYRKGTRQEPSTHDTIASSEESDMLTPDRIEQAIAFLEKRLSSRTSGGGEGDFMDGEGRGGGGGGGIGHSRNPGPDPMTVATMDVKRLNQLPHVLYLGGDAPNAGHGAPLGSLYRFATKSGQVQWICEEHSLKVYDSLNGISSSGSNSNSEGRGQQKSVEELSIHLEVSLMLYPQSHLDRRLRKLTTFAQNADMLMNVLKIALEHDACLSEVEVTCDYPWSKTDLKFIHNVLNNSQSIQSIIFNGYRRGQKEGSGGGGVGVLRSMFSLSSSSPPSSTENAGGIFRMVFGRTISSSRTKQQPAMLSARLVGPETGILSTDLNELPDKGKYLRVLHLSGSVATQTQPHLLEILQKCSSHLTEFSLGQPNIPGSKVTESCITNVSSAAFWRVIGSLKRLETLSLYFIHAEPTIECLSAFTSLWSLPTLRHMTLVLYNSLDALFSLGKANLQHLETFSIQHVAAWRRGFLYEPIVLSTVEPHIVNGHRAIEYDLPKEISRKEMERLVPLLSQHCWTHYGCNLPMVEEEWKETKALIQHVESLGSMRRLYSVRLTRFPANVHCHFWENYFRPPSNFKKDEAEFASSVWIRPLRYLFLQETNMPSTLISHIHQIRLRRLALHYCIRDNVAASSASTSSSPWIIHLLSQLALQRLERLMITGAQLGESGVQTWMSRGINFSRDRMIYLLDRELTDEQVDRMQGTWLEDALQSLMPSHITEQKQFDSFGTFKVLHGGSLSDLDPAPCWVRNEQRYDREEFVMFYGNNFFP